MAMLQIPGGTHEATRIAPDDQSAKKIQILQEAHHGITYNLQHKIHQSGLELGSFVINSQLNSSHTVCSQACHVSLQLHTQALLSPEPAGACLCCCTCWRQCRDKSAALELMWRSQLLVSGMCPFCAEGFRPACQVGQACAQSLKYQAAVMRCMPFRQAFA